MRACWIDEGNDPDYVLGDKYFVDEYLLPSGEHSLTINAIHIQAVRSHLKRVAVVWNPHHARFAGLTAQQFANQVSTEIDFLGQNNKQCECWINMETHDMGFCTLVWVTLRDLRPGRYLNWALEGFQGGLVASAAGTLQKLNIKLHPESYGGNMDAERWAEDAVKDDLRGSAPGCEVRVIYDAKLAPTDGRWDGSLFPMGRLPQK